MHSYQHNIKTFNHATRHLTRVERALYRDLIELYYDTEQPLTSDKNRLYKLVMAHSEDEKNAVNDILSEFFVLTGDVYTHDYCDFIIDKYHNGKTQQSIAGKASAAARKAKAEARKTARSTSVQRAFNERSTEGQQNGNQQETINHKPINHKQVKSISSDVITSKPIAISFDYSNGKFLGLSENKVLIDSWHQAYPAVDIRKELEAMRAWMLSNPKNKKTNIQRFANTWLSKAQDQAVKPTGKTWAEKNDDYQKLKAEERFKTIAGADNETLKKWGLVNE